MIKKLFGGKSNEFFLELDETGKNQATETKAEEKQLEPVAVATEEKQPEPAATQEPEKQPEVVETKSATKSKKTSIKNRKKKATKTAVTPSPTPTPVSSSSTSSWEPPFWVKAMYNSSSSNGSNGKVEGGEQTFATDNLLPTPSTFRRRPGPSLNKFKEMARQAKTPRR